MRVDWCRVMKEMLEKKSQLRLLYVTPEKCSKSKQFMAKLQKMYQMGRLDRIAIGEMGTERHSGIYIFEYVQVLVLRGGGGV